jgi:hypothetical protein
VDKPSGDLTRAREPERKPNDASDEIEKRKVADRARKATDQAKRAADAAIDVEKGKLHE